MLVHNYLAIPASARTNDCHHCQMGSEKFKELQQLRLAYHNGQLKAVNEAWMEIGPVLSSDQE